MYELEGNEICSVWCITAGLNVMLLSVNIMLTDS